MSVDRRAEEEVKLHPLERRQMADTLATAPHPTVWVRHFNFIDFESLDVAPPTWINIVRDPVSLHSTWIQEYLGTTINLTKHY